MDSKDAHEERGASQISGDQSREKDSSQNSTKGSKARWRRWSAQSSRDNITRNAPQKMRAYLKALSKLHE